MHDNAPNAHSLHFFSIYHQLLRINLNGWRKLIVEGNNEGRLKEGAKHIYPIGYSFRPCLAYFLYCHYLLHVHKFCRWMDIPQNRTNVSTCYQVQGYIHRWIKYLINRHSILLGIYFIWLLQYKGGCSIHAKQFMSHHHWWCSHSFPEVEVLCVGEFFVPYCT